MRDLNFFSGFIQDKRKKNRGGKIVGFLALVTISVAAAGIIYLRVGIASVQGEIDKYNGILSSETTKEEEVQLSESVNRYNNVMAFKEQVEGVVKYVDENDKITTALILRIFKALPESVDITAFSIDGETFSMQCKGGDMNDYNSTIRNLKFIGVKNVMPSAMTKSDKDGVVSVQFQITGEIEGGKENE